ncbi:MAG: single-stranded DNA-binding protein [Clostridiaceae bacterium]
MNKVSLIGNLVREAESYQIKDGSRSVIKFTIGVNSSFIKKNGERDVDFIPVSYWTNQAENMLPYLSKGKQVAVTGEIKTGNYVGEDGNKRYVTEVRAGSIQFLGGSAINQ